MSLTTLSRGNGCRGVRAKRAQANPAKFRWTLQRPFRGANFAGFAVSACLTTLLHLNLHLRLRLRLLLWLRLRLQLWLLLRLLLLLLLLLLLVQLLGLLL